MISWSTAFDVASEPFRWGSAGEGLVALSILALGVAAALALRGRSRAAAGAALAIALGGVGAYVERTVRHRIEHGRCVDASLQGDGRVVEGEVRGYRPASAGWGSGDATLTVGGEPVRYPLLAGGCGYHQAAGDLRLRDGDRVRLRLWKGQILKVEIVRQR